ncbi:MAG TPA: RMD1 family protein, partial [Cryomorphaceae bacterium]|nr:RMD1 family protein [Cryomorphaceae bacterium]
LGRFDDAVNKMIMLHLAQSVVLDHFFYSSQGLLTEIKEHTQYMQEKGKIRLGQKDTLRFIGKTLSAKNHIAENLYILDSPEQTWNDEYLEALHAKLKNYLDQAQRYRVIENTLRIAEENLSIYASYNDHRESSRLEWIIIILIVIEVIDTFASKLI